MILQCFVRKFSLALSTAIALALFFNKSSHRVVPYAESARCRRRETVGERVEKRHSANKQEHEFQKRHNDVNRIEYSRRTAEFRDEFARDRPGAFRLIQIHIVVFGFGKNGK